MAKKRYIQFVEFDGGCYVPMTHALNADGYYRRIWPNRVYEMFHRFIWRIHNGSIPEGFEINHKCKNRACCNPEHLETLSNYDHTVLTNKERYLDRKKVGLALLYFGESVKEVMKLLEVSQSTVYNWKKEN